MERNLMAFCFFAMANILKSGDFTFADPASQQLPIWAQKNNQRSEVITNFLGTPMKSLTASLTPDKINGPIFVHDTNFFEQMASFDRERIPERVVHARGAGAHGVFKVTHSITKYTKAQVFSKIGLETPVFVRFSTVGGESGSSDSAQDPRGFATKFYTQQGIWDLVGNNLPVFPIRDAILFSSLMHTRKRNPVTHLPDMNMFWDFISLRPESAHHTLMLFSDLGLPDGFRFMNGFGVHAFKFVNEQGEISFVKFHWLSMQGIRTLSWEQAVRIAGIDPNYSTRDLYNAIEERNYPSWKMHIQIMSPAQAAQFNWTFDVAHIWPEDKFPLMPVGELTLDRNQKNFFLEVEQAAFHPGNLVPGIQFSPDRLLQGRSFSYSDAQRYRLGPNFLQLPINRPKTEVVHSYMRDGQGCMAQDDSPSYFPNSFNGPSIVQQDVPEEVCGFADRYDSGPAVDNFSQATTFYNTLKPGEKLRLAENIVRSLRQADKSVQDRVLANVFANVDRDLYRNIKLGLFVEATTT